MAFVSQPLPSHARRAPPRKCPPRLAAAQDPSSESLPTESDWRAFRARLIRQQHSSSDAPAAAPVSFAHTLTTPETGALLLANPSFFATSQAYFRRAAILLFAHEPSTGTAGLLLNRPPSAVTTPVPTPPSPFDSSAVRLGGDVGDGTLFALYPTPTGVETSHPAVLPGVSMLTDVRDVKRSVENGEIKPEEVMLYTRYCGWAPGQLVSEVKRGVWYLAAASSDFVLDCDAEALYGRLIGELGIDAGK